MFWILVTLGSIVGSVLGGFGALLGTPDSAPDTDAALVVSYSQADHDEIVGSVGPSEVVDDEAERADLVRRLAFAGPAVEIEAVDLTTHVIVAGGYHRCTESSRVVEDGDSWRFEVVVSGDETVACVWSPFTVDVYAVERPEPRTLVTQWSQADSPDLVQDWQVEGQVLDTDVARDAFVAGAPATLRPEVAAVVDPVDLATHLLVVGGYARCTEHSEVGPGPSFVVVDDEEGAVCDWAPYTVDVHVVPR